ncbi:MAG: lytic murein transglycosylase [Pseudomonadota bacterium]
MDYTRTFTMICSHFLHEPYSMKKIISIRFVLVLLAFTTLMLPEISCAKSHHHSKKSSSVSVTAKHKAVKKTLATEESEFTNFMQWKAVAEFVSQMGEQHGFNQDELNTLFSQVHYLEKVVKLINPAPSGKSKNWTAYKSRFVEPLRIRTGLLFWEKYETELRRAQTEFGVPPEIIVGILGVETIYGRSPGNIRVMDALTTLAFAYPETANREERMRYFRDELEQILLYSRENNIDPLSVSGSFAGAIGYPQFMPSSIRRFAVDFDGDGRIDLRNSPVDAIGSVASFLSQHGWTANLPLAYPVSVDKSAESEWKPLIGVVLAATNTTDEIGRAGVTLPVDISPTLMVGLIDLEDGIHPTQYWLGSANFFAITKYNRSYYYAMAVIELSKAIKQRH